jgi:hypothetical protein
MCLISQKTRDIVIDSRGIVVGGGGDGDGGDGDGDGGGGGVGGGRKASDGERN